MKLREGMCGKVALLIILLCVAEPVFAIVNVPTDYPTIQEAVDNAASGEMVLVQPGVYEEHIEMRDAKEYILTGVDRDTTIIDGTKSGLPIYAWSSQNITISNL